MAVLVAPEHWSTNPVDEYPSTIEYPESDGKPMGETDWHISVILYLRTALRFFFRDVKDLYVAADMLFYYAEGNPRRFKVPDVFVVKGVHREDRAIYKLWEEGVAPCVVFEITSRSTRGQDTGEKKELYQNWGVQEYFLFDPLNEYLKPRLQGFRLVQGSYQPIAPASDSTLYSQELNLSLQADGRKLRLVDPRTGDFFPSMEEAAERAQAEAERRQRAESKAEQLEREIAELRRQLEERNQRKSE